MDFHWFERSLANLDTMKKNWDTAVHAVHSVFHNSEQQPQVELLETFFHPKIETAESSLQFLMLSEIISVIQPPELSSLVNFSCAVHHVWETSWHRWSNIYSIFFNHSVLVGPLLLVCGCEQYEPVLSNSERGECSRGDGEWEAERQRVSLAKLQRFTAEVLNPLTWFPSSY